MKKPYKSGKPQASGFKGIHPTKPVHKHITTAIPLALDRYKQATDPLRKMLGVHGSTKISPLMAKKYVHHSNPQIANAAKKLSKGYDSSIGSNT